jgi:glutamate carboxypeptidase
VTLEITSETSPWPVNPSTESLLRLWVESGTALGLSVEGEIRGGLSDGNHLWEGVPTLDGLGPSGGNAHCSERNPEGTKLPEYVLPGSFPPKALLNAVAIGRLLESRRNG